MLILTENHFKSERMPLLSKAVPDAFSLETFEFRRVRRNSIRYIWLFRTMENILDLHASSTRELVQDDFFSLSSN